MHGYCHSTHDRHYEHWCNHRCVRVRGTRRNESRALTSEGDPSRDTNEDDPKGWNHLFPVPSPTLVFTPNPLFGLRLPLLRGLWGRAGATGGGLTDGEKSQSSDEP